MLTNPDRDNRDRPYPLFTRFVRFVVPGFLLFVASLAVASGLGARSIVEATYLEQATRRAAQISSQMDQVTPLLWANVRTGLTLDENALRQVHKAFATIREQFGLIGLKVYDHRGRTLYSTEIGEIGLVETSAALEQVVASGRPMAVSKTESNGEMVYELYVPHFTNGEAAAVFELYEPMGGLQSILIRTMAWTSAIPAVFLVSLLGLLTLLVRGAQRSIDSRTLTIVQLRQRIEQLVSRHAVAAVSEHPEQNSLAPRLIETTILFSDVRGYTTFSEDRSAAEVVAIVDSLMGLVADCVEAQGGDIDKFMGDAMLARFDGDDREARSLEAARSILEKVRMADLPLRVGIGISSGRVVAGMIGSEKRRDYSLFGDSVNVASRLCSLAEADEILIDEPTYRRSGHQSDASKPEPMLLKGRRKPIIARRLCGAVGKERNRLVIAED